MSTPKLIESFSNPHIIPHINFSPTVWDGCSEIHLSELNSRQRRAAKLLNPDETVSTDEKQKARSILPLQRQLDFNKALFKANRSMVPSFIPSLSLASATTELYDAYYLSPA